MERLCSVCENGPLLIIVTYLQPVDIFSNIIFVNCSFYRVSFYCLNRKLISFSEYDINSLLRGVSLKTTGRGLYHYRRVCGSLLLKLLPHFDVNKKIELFSSKEDQFSSHKSFKTDYLTYCLDRRLSECAKFVLDHSTIFPDRVNLYRYTSRGYIDYGLVKRIVDRCIKNQLEISDELVQTFFHDGELKLLQKCLEISDHTIRNTRISFLRSIIEYHIKDKRDLKWFEFWIYILNHKKWGVEIYPFDFLYPLHDNIEHISEGFLLNSLVCPIMIYKNDHVDGVVSYTSCNHELISTHFIKRVFELKKMNSMILIAEGSVSWIKKEHPMIFEWMVMNNSENELIKYLDGFEPHKINFENFDFPIEKVRIILESGKIIPFSEKYFVGKKSIEWIGLFLSYCNPLLYPYAASHAIRLGFDELCRYIISSVGEKFEPDLSFLQTCIEFKKNEYFEEYLEKEIFKPYKNEDLCTLLNASFQYENFEAFEKVFRIESVVPNFSVFETLFLYHSDQLQILESLIERREKYFDKIRWYAHSPSHNIPPNSLRYYQANEKYHDERVRVNFWKRCTIWALNQKRENFAVFLFEKLEDLKYDEETLLVSLQCSMPSVCVKLMSRFMLSPGFLYNDRLGSFFRNAFSLFKFRDVCLKLLIDVDLIWRPSIFCLFIKNYPGIISYFRELVSSDDFNQHEKHTISCSGCKDQILDILFGKEGKDWFFCGWCAPLDYESESKEWVIFCNDCMDSKKIVCKNCQE